MACRTRLQPVEGTPGCIYFTPPPQPVRTPVPLAPQLPSSFRRQPSRECASAPCWGLVWMCLVAGGPDHRFRGQALPTLWG